MSERKPLALDIVVPLYNEETGIERFHLQVRQVAARLEAETTIYYVNDGSTDGTGAVLEKIAKTDPRVVVVELSRNFGHQAALTAGLDVANGDVVVTMDGDGQHPPNLLPEMLTLFKSGYDVVLTQRDSTREGGAFKRLTSEGFYWVLSRISDTDMVSGCADYRLMSRSVVDALGRMREYHRFLRGMVAWLGYRTVILPYSEEPRVAGGSKYSLRKMIRLSTDAISSFSLVPLRIGVVLGTCFLAFAVLEVTYVLLFWVRGEQHLLAPGWSSLMFVLLLVGGTVMVTLGVIGIYIGNIFQEVKRRPVYVVRRLRLSGPAGQLRPEDSEPGETKERGGQ
jgi:polyisoprenyl-phosphate glycosyltransferase